MGQHYLVDGSVVARILDLASIQRGERVLEIGTGRGALTRELVNLTDKVEGYEVDKESCEELEKELGHTALVLHNKDAFESRPVFDVLLSSLPYSESSVFIEWISHQRYDRAVVVLQADFARKITAAPGGEAYRAVSVIAQASSHVEVVSGIGRQSFDPPPRVNSSLVEMRWKRSLTPEQTALIRRVFSQKRRTLRAALKSLGMELPPSSPLSADSRVNKLEPESVMSLIEAVMESITAGLPD